MTTREKEKDNNRKKIDFKGFFLIEVQYRPFMQHDLSSTHTCIFIYLS